MLHPHKRAHNMSSNHDLCHRHRKHNPLPEHNPPAKQQTTNNQQERITGETSYSGKPLPPTGTWAKWPRCSKKPEARAHQ